MYSVAEFFSMKRQHVTHFSSDKTSWKQNFFFLSRLRFPLSCLWITNFKLRHFFNPLTFVIVLWSNCGICCLSQLLLYVRLDIKTTFVLFVPRLPWKLVYLILYVCFIIIYFVFFIWNFSYIYFCTMFHIKMKKNSSIFPDQYFSVEDSDSLPGGVL